jgi:hypothetical protein
MKRVRSRAAKVSTAAWLIPLAVMLNTSFEFPHIVICDHICVKHWPDTSFGVAFHLLCDHKEAKETVLLLIESRARTTRAGLPDP